MEDMDSEWKLIWKDDYLKTVSAFYNTAGGRMMIGVDDDGNYVGVDDPKSQLKAISDTIRNKLHIPVSVRSEVFDGRTCITIDVPPGDDGVSFDGKVYVRQGNTTQNLDGSALFDFVNTRLNRSWMNLPSKYTKQDISAEALKFYIESGQAADRIPSDVRVSDIDKILHRYRMVSDDGRITNAAALLFLEKPRMVDGSAYLKIGQFDEKGILRRETIVEGPLIEIPDRAIGILYESYIPDVFRYGGVARRIAEVYPRKAVRELMINALIHKSYQKNMPVSVAVYPDSMYIYGYGNLPDGWTIDTLLGSHSSICRNPVMSEVFHDAGFIEAWGQGIRLVLDSCRDNGNPEPRFEMFLGGLKVTLFKKKLIENTAEVAGTLSSLTGTQVAILSALAEDPSLSALQIAERIEKSKTTVFRVLSGLSEMGYIEKDGQGPKRRYIVKPV